MACVAPRVEWTIEVINDNSSERITLIFCLTIQSGTITGIVSERINDELRFLSYVSGTDQPIDRLPNVSLRTLNFVWRSTRVFVAGIALLALTPRIFRGRFAASGVSSLAPADDPDSVMMMSPGDGDTGTANGQQT